MAHKMIKFYSLLFYLLSLVLSFFVGMQLAALFEVHKNQGLAGGAIVFGYGVIAAFFGIIISLFIASKASKKTVKILNLIFALLIALFIIYIYFNKQGQIEERTINKNKTKSKIELKATTANLIALQDNNQIQRDGSIGIGMFSPNTFDYASLLLYNNINLEKSFLEHSPSDSITFRRIQNGGFEIATAPPYLFPEHMKLDYDVLIFKAISISKDFIEIEVNKKTQQTAYVKKTSGKYQPYQEFFLSVSSIEFINPDVQNVHLKPLENSSKIKVDYQFMKPIQVRSQWLLVSLRNDKNEHVGKGWIRWNKNGKLLVNYSLFL